LGVYNLSNIVNVELLRNLDLSDLQLVRHLGDCVLHLCLFFLLVLLFLGCLICCNCCCFELLLLSAFLSLDQLTLRTLFFFGGFLALLVFSWGFLIILLFTVICRLQPRDKLGHQGLELLFRLAITQNIIFVKLLLSRMPVNKELVAEHALIVEQFAEGA